MNTEPVIPNLEKEPGGERRNATVLFADLCDYTGLSEKIDDEEIYEMLQLYLRMLVDMVSLYDGIVDKIIGDGVMALFGAPVAYENAPERAIRSALDMLAGLNRLNQDLKSRVGEELKMHIGIHAGSVILGSVEKGANYEFTAIGETVNLARRLQEASAPGNILVSERVYQSTKVLFDFRTVPALRLKGIAQPIEGYYLAGIKEKPGRTRGVEGFFSPMVGREAELDALRASVEGLCSDHHGRLIFVCGEAGIGKSRLLAEFKELIAEKNLTVLEGQSLTYRKSASYWIFNDLLRNYLKVTADTPQAQLRERLVSRASAILGANSREALPYLENLLSLGQSDETIAQRMALLDAEQLRRQSFLSIRNLLWGEARLKPIVVVLEDLHWADGVSLDLLEFLIDGLLDVPILFVGVTRNISDSRLATVVDLGRRRLGERCSAIELLGLNDAQSEQLLAHLLGSHDFPTRLIDQIIQSSNGIPFYIEEMLRMFIDKQLLVRDQGKWILVEDPAAGNGAVPENLQDLILARFDRLDSDQRLILQIATVIGRQFNLGLLELAVRPLGVSNIGQTVGALVEKSFILPLSSVEGEFTFRHVLTSDAIYRTLLRRDRARLHTLVGEAIEASYSDKLDNYVEVLAAHFLRTPHLQKALHYLILAGERAVRDYANAQANRHFKEARSLLSKVDHTPEQALRIFINLGDVLTFIGEYERARDSLTEGLQVIESMQPYIDVQKHCAIHRKIGTTFERQGDFEKALLHLTEANKALGKTAFLSPGSKAEIMNDLGWIHFLRGNFEEAQRAFEGGLRLVEGTTEYGVVASIQNRLGAVAYQKRDYEEAANRVRKSLALRRTIGDLSGVARLYNNLGLLNLMRGQLREAEEDFFQSIDLLDKIGDAEGIALTNINIGLVKFDRGQFDSAATYLEKAQAVADQIGHRFYLALARLYLGRLMTELNLFAGAARLLDSGLHLFADLGSQDNMIDALGYLAENSLSWGDSEGGIRWTQAMSEAIAKATTDGSADVPIQRGRMLRLRGRIARLRKEFDRAGQSLTESYNIFIASTEKLESARTIYELGLLARDQAEDFKSQQLFHEARLLFQQIGAERDLKKVEEALHLPYRFQS
jgi:class 3 adenylate cyclase/tetratricopeptide (TPR) repeat protein